MMKSNGAAGAAEAMEKEGMGIRREKRRRIGFEWEVASLFSGALVDRREEKHQCPYLPLYPDS